MTEILNKEPTIWSEGLTVERLNALLDTVTIKKFLSASLAAQTIRACLDLHGITLPILEVEGGSGGYYGPSNSDGHAILIGTSSMSNPDMYAPPTEGEWLFKIVDSDGPDDDFDDHLSLYIVMDKDDDNLIECYAQIVNDDEVDALADMDNMTDFDFQRAVGGSIDNKEVAGDRSGESIWQRQQRHLGGYKLKD
jgi:hypothetical protein